MYRITRLNRDGDTVADLVQAAITSSLQCGDNQYLAIRGINSVIRQVVKNPDTIRVMTQSEFGYDGVIDGNDKNLPDSLNPLEVEWFDSSFVIADYAKLLAWTRKAHIEANKGRTVVMLLPARTNTRWFHSQVLPCASEIRFIKGYLTMKGETRRNPLPDCLAIYNKVVAALPAQPSSGFALIGMKTSFTDDRNDVLVEESEEEEEDDDQN